MVSGVSFSGLASGLDTDEIMEQLMHIESRPLRQLEEKEQLQKLQQEAWQEFNMLLSNLDSSLSPLRQSSTFGSYQAQSSDEKLLSASTTQETEEADYRIQIGQLARAHRVASDEVTGELSESIDFGESGEMSFDLVVDEDTTHQVTVYDTDTLRDVRDRINAVEDYGIKASVVADHLVLQAEDTGGDSQIQLNDIEGEDLLQQLGVLNQQGEFEQVLTEPQDAEFTVDGLSVTRGTNYGIDDVIDGVTLDLHGASGGETVNLSVRQDTQQAVEAAQEFAAQYNQVQTQIGQLAGEEGLLAGDGTLRRLQSSLRTNFTSPVSLQGDQQYSMLAEVGVEVDRDGEMSVDADQLSQALAENPEDVQLLFSGRESSHGADGAARRLGDHLTGYLRYGDGILDRQDAMYDRMLRTTADRIESTRRRLERREENLSRQFTQMENMLSEVQSQGQWLEGQIQNLPGVNRSE